MSDADSNVQGGEGKRGPNTYAVADRTLDPAFDLLASHRRRAVIATLQVRPNGVASVDGLADQLLALDPDADDRDRMLVALHHETLPRLDDAGVVDLDRRTDTVRYYGDEQVEDLLAFIADTNR